MPDISVTAGIGFGFAAAVCQSLSYMFSRAFTGTGKGSVWELLIKSHLIMGAFSVLIIVVIRPAHMPPLSDYLAALCGATFFYLGGQVCLFLALVHTAASRVAPLLGIKVIILAVLSIILLNQSYSPVQWSAVALCVFAAFLLNRPGGSISGKSLLWILGASTLYALSDIYIKKLVDGFSDLGLLHASAFSVGMSYTVCGICAFPLLIVFHKRMHAGWKSVLPFTGAWFCAILFLYACFGSAGVVLGNIIQSTRGIISIALGAGAASLGYINIEQKVSSRVLILRSGAAVLMIGAIALFLMA